MTDRKFHQLQTARLADVSAERVRRDHELAIRELQDMMRTVLGAVGGSICVGFAQFSISGDQAIASAPDTVAIDTEDENLVDEIAYLSGNSIEVDPGYAYRLTAHVAINGSGDAGIFEWYDETDAAVRGIPAEPRATDSSGTYSSQPVASAIVLPTTRRKYSLRCTYVSTSLSVYAAETFVTVEVYQR